MKDTTCKRRSVSSVWIQIPENERRVVRLKMREKVQVGGRVGKGSVGEDGGMDSTSPFFFFFLCFCIFLFV